MHFSIYSDGFLFLHRPTGNTAAAAFNAVLGNLLGVVVTPALLLLFLGRRLDMAPSLLATFKKLGIKVGVYNTGTFLPYAGVMETLKTAPWEICLHI